ncbi:MAG: hypothetical protein U9O96_00005 [Candidatus Thermoplasmatota archaeon]|nr:hypothetical protein [Candidatus Thermoplasmatota archaeon]
MRKVKNKARLTAVTAIAFSPIILPIMILIKAIWTIYAYMDEAIHMLVKGK